MRTSTAGGPGVEALIEAAREARDWIEGSVCEHEDTHRGGAIWTICRQCGEKWADDEGGFVPAKNPKAAEKLDAALASITE